MVFITSTTPTLSQFILFFFLKPLDHFLTLKQYGCHIFYPRVQFLCPSAGLSKALFLYSHNLLPKLLPQKIKSVEFIQVDGGAGTISQINFAEGSQFKIFRHKIDAVDKENLSYKYTLIEGDVLGDKIEKIAYDVKCEATNDGGYVCKTTCKYHTVGDFEIKEEEIKAGKAKP